MTKITFVAALAVSILFFSTLVGGAGAQTTTQSAQNQLNQNPSNVVRQAVPEKPNPDRAPIGAPSLPEDARLALEAAVDDPRTIVRTVNVSGTDEWDAETLERTIQEVRAEDSTMNLAELRYVAATLQAKIRNDGFVFTRVFAPRALAEVKDGVAMLTVVQAHIKQVFVAESAEPVGPVLRQLYEMSQQLANKRNPHIHDIERTLLLMNDLPGITRATAVPTRGEGYEPGELDLTINVERKPVSGVIFADNRQAPSVGQGLIGASVEFGSWGAAADTLTVTALNSFWDSVDDLEERHLGQLVYERQLNDDGLKLEVRGLFSSSRPGANLEPVDLHSRQYELEVALEYPILRTRRDGSVWLRLSTEFRDSRTTIPGTPTGRDVQSRDRVRVVELSAHGIRRDSTGFTLGELGIRQGLDILGARSKGDANISRNDGKATATVFFAEIEREQRIMGPFSAFARVAGQISTEDLLASEEFAVGGGTFGRGYDPSEFLGDDGIGVQFELRYDADLNGLTALQDLSFGPLQLYAFMDYGHIWNSGSGSGDDDVHSVGGGFRLTLPQQAQLSLEIAKPLTDLQRTGDDDFRVYFQAQKTF